MVVILYGPKGDKVRLSGVERTVVRTVAYLKERGYTEEPETAPEPLPVGKKARKRRPSMESVPEDEAQVT